MNNVLTEDVRTRNASSSHNHTAAYDQGRSVRITNEVLDYVSSGDHIRQAVLNAIHGIAAYEEVGNPARTGAADLVISQGSRCRGRGVKENSSKSTSARAGSVDGDRSDSVIRNRIRARAEVVDTDEPTGAAFGEGDGRRSIQTTDAVASGGSNIITTGREEDASEGRAAAGSGAGCALADSRNDVVLNTARRDGAGRRQIQTYEQVRCAADCCCSSSGCGTEANRISGVSVVKPGRAHQDARVFHGTCREHPWCCLVDPVVRHCGGRGVGLKIYSSHAESRAEEVEDVVVVNDVTSVVVRAGRSK